MKLTVVIPVYNVREYVGECLGSLPGGCRVVLVNDGSTDGSDAICREFAASRPEVTVVDKPNGGLSDARNFGMRYVDTEYVFFLDSDDRVDPANLTAALDFAVANGLDWLQCGYAYDYGDRALTFRRPPRRGVYDRMAIVSRLVSDGFVKNFAWGKIYRTAIAGQFEFPKGKYFEDSYWQHLVVDRSERFGIFPATVTFYRQRSTGISGCFSLRNLDLVEGLTRRLEFLVARPGRYAPVVDIAAASLWELSEMFTDLAIKTIPESAPQFAKAAGRIRRDYAAEIARGVARRPLLKRLELRARLRRDFATARRLDLAARVIDRFKIPNLRTI